jgi:hypothetical protein
MYVTILLTSPIELIAIGRRCALQVNMDSWQPSSMFVLVVQNIFTTLAVIENSVNIQAGDLTV